MLISQGSFQFALWVNTSKNPRMKTVEMPQMNLVIDIPKQIALASVSMRVQVRVRDGSERLAAILQFKWGSHQ